jgi:hypothetical protein
MREAIRDQVTAILNEHSKPEPRWRGIIEQHPWLLGVLIWITSASVLVFAGTVQSLLDGGGCK